MDSTNERLETTDKLVLRIENWLKKLAENNESSMNQTHLLDQSLIELTHEVGILHTTSTILDIFLGKILLVFNYIYLGLQLLSILFATIFLLAI